MFNPIAPSNLAGCNTADQAPTVTAFPVTPLSVTRAWDTPKDRTVNQRMRRYRARRRLVKLIEAARLAGCTTWELRTAVEKALA